MTWTSLGPNKRPTATEPISPLPTVPAASALAIHTAFVTADDAARIAKAVKRAYRTACGRKGHIPIGTDLVHWEREAVALKSIMERFKRISDAS